MSRRCFLAAVAALLLLGAPRGAAGVPGRLPEDAEQEHGYYLRQLFGQYGHNGTLPFEGLARLLGSLGLGTVRVVQIQHEELGHGHAAHLDLLEVQEDKHRHRHPLRDLLGRVLGLEHSSTDHPHDDCLNGTQLLLNFGLDSAAQLTPEQFSLLCPALLYQIDSRVCIQHPLGWALLAVLSVSLPSVLAVPLLPPRARGSRRSVFAFLVPLAAGTLCGDALLHLWPHANGSHPEAPGEPSPAVLQGLAVLAGVYLLFVLELLLGVLRHRREATVRARPAPEPPVPADTGGSRGVRPAAGTELRHLTAPEPELEPGPPEPHREPHREPPPGASHGHSHGHSHGPGPGAADIAWMVVLGDGVHNLTDGLAIGATGTGTGRDRAGTGMGTGTGTAKGTGTGGAGRERGWERGQGREREWERQRERERGGTGRERGWDGDGDGDGNGDGNGGGNGAGTGRGRESELGLGWGWEREREREWGRERGRERERERGREQRRGQRQNRGTGGQEDKGTRGQGDRDRGRAAAPR
uniref:Solute carrier family 39 member 5 n=1 Tax=Taeniopygia guttata TaxID=59729 RepID=A0A674GGH2_TAEGU